MMENGGSEGMEPTTTPSDRTAVGFRLRRVVTEPPAQPQISGSVPEVTTRQDGPAPERVGVPVVDPATRRELVRLVGVLVEALDGRRPLAQLATRGLIAPEVARYLRAERRADQHRQASRVGSVHVYAPRADAVEIAAVCRIRGAIRAVALRAERDEHPYDGRPWRVVALRIIRGPGTGRAR
jgi:hypothetical protein